MAKLNRDRIRKILEPLVEEQATGLVQTHALGKYYNHKEEVLLVDAAKREVVADGVEVPNAGAGSYKEFFRSLGYKEARTIESSSSAGDWTLAVFDGTHWHPGFQSNRYPYYGFKYVLDPRVSAKTFEKLCQMVMG